MSQDWHKTFATIALGAVLLCSPLAVQAEIQRPTWILSAIDGDTIRLYNGVKVRLMDYDTPEISRPKCPGEYLLGMKATVRLRQLITGGGFALQFKHKRNGRLAKDKYQRLLARASAYGQPVAEILVIEGLARYYDGRSKRLSWCQ